MIGKTERKKGTYKVLLRQIATFAFVKARCENGTIALQVLYEKFGQLMPSDVVSFMNEPVLNNMFRREITGNGIVYRLTGRFRYAEFDEVNRYMNEQLKKKKVEKKK